MNSNPNCGAIRKITNDAYKAWVKGRNHKRDNTVVTPTSVFLFNHEIIRRPQPSYHPEQGIFFSMCGYNTRTTRERLKIADITVVSWHNQPLLIGTYDFYPLTENGISEEPTRMCDVPLEAPLVYFCNTVTKVLKPATSKDLKGTSWD